MIDDEKRERYARAIAADAAGDHGAVVREAAAIDREERTARRAALTAQRAAYVEMLDDPRVVPPARPEDARQALIRAFRRAAAEAAGQPLPPNYISPRERAEEHIAGRLRVIDAELRRLDRADALEGSPGLD